MASKRKRSQSVSWRNTSWGSEDNGTMNVEAHGVQIEYVCGGVPVLTMDTSSVFHEHVSCMLQAAVSSGGKVDSLYDYCEDQDICIGCRKKGHRSDDIMIGRLKKLGIRAVGASGKRSLVLGLVIAVAQDKGCSGSLSDLWELLDSYKLTSKFKELLPGTCQDDSWSWKDSWTPSHSDDQGYWKSWNWSEDWDWDSDKSSATAVQSNKDGNGPVLSRASRKENCAIAVEWRQDDEQTSNVERFPNRSQSHHTSSSEKKSRPLDEKRPSPKDSASPMDIAAKIGVGLDFVCGQVPVVGVDKLSMFQESASWLLQTALSSDSKVDSLYRYCNSSDILSECKQLGFTKDEICIASPTRADLASVKAVGIGGKRSTMVAIVLALVLQDKLHLEKFAKAIWAYDSKLEQAFLALVRICMKDKGAPTQPALKRLKGLTEGLTPTPEELKARKERAQRFEKAATAPVALPFETEGNVFEDTVRKVTLGTGKPIEGSCTDLERPYFRLSTGPRPSDVRPVSILKRSLALVQEKWSKNRDWAYTCEMLMSIRQDLTVQMVRSSFTVEVYEFCARSALEVGDFRQFDQCSPQLEELYADAEIGLGTTAPEFLSYRLLYLTLQGTVLMLSAFLQRHGQRLRALVSAGHEQVTFAWQLRAALAEGRLVKAARLVERVSKVGVNGNIAEKASNGVVTNSVGKNGFHPNGQKDEIMPVDATSAHDGVTSATLRLASTLLETACADRVCAVCKAFKPHVTKQALGRCVPSRSVSVFGVPVVFSAKDPKLVDTAATLAGLPRSVISSGGSNRRRLGEERSDHVRDFVRAGVAGTASNGSCPTGFLGDDSIATREETSSSGRAVEG